MQSSGSRVHSSQHLWEAGDGDAMDDDADAPLPSAPPSLPAKSGATARESVDRSTTEGRSSDISDRDGGKEGGLRTEMSVEEAREELLAREWVKSARAGAEAVQADAMHVCGAGANAQAAKAFAGLGMCGSVISRCIAEPDAVSSSAVGRRGLGLRAPTKV